MAMAVTEVVQQGLNGIRWFRGTLRAGAEVSMELEPGTPSLVAAVVAWPRSAQPVRFILEDPEGHQIEDGPGVEVACTQGSPRAYAVNDPAEGTWRIRILEAEPCDARLEVAVLAAAQDEPRDSLLAAAATVPDDAVHSLPRGTAQLLVPACIALQPHCGTRIEGKPPAVIAAADVTGAEPDDIQDAMEAIPQGSPLWRIAQAVATAAGI